MSTLRIIQLTEVIQKTSISKSTIYRKIEKGLFPPPVRLDDCGSDSNTRRVGWFESEVDDWILSRPRVLNFSSEDFQS
ncbi:TPA: AlpA family phage regulatory protein [Vibrio parahaemolyticus]|uniref:helix-turn-helix transcriptional regulator n=1 Tax=Vibrio harveyi group TaxID=717610 RepID=UPI00111031E7|nr:MULTISPECIES: AlpA family phage regulatory protein [Vibrio harveyi group]MBE4440616.1 AlpA family phage regulatory protein [Vibrio parahaemolyticus]MCR9881054.1 AlpA family phage regulatory protein [Vibrio parahaemolyticus]MCR9895460.1 AlpA family phage regulatory protein [Vibrio parahaemolyticus]MDF5057505.1 AlpA family phage regulatory protein [Vibrio parahaemolyticus]TMX33312.1 AlpA family transcriptional regulator [Vibrio parahaemolyticus]